MTTPDTPIAEPQLPKTFDPASFEQRLYQESLDSFKPSGEGEPFTILMPPPNVTGKLHVGHALNHTLQDILARYHRGQGYSVLWQPGMDHAGIATQLLVEKQLDSEGTSRKELGREKFLERVWDWKEQYGGAIIGQLQRLGVSADWSRLRFTMDEGCSDHVQDAFLQYYEDGLIYRGARLVNWDCQLQTAISDLEVDSREVDGAYYHINYALEDGSGVIEIATTRPETLLGDSAVAVHPEDERYQHLVGKRVRLPLTDRLIPIVTDEYSDPEKGTGAVKITPAHDFNDFEVGERHNLEKINILNRDGTLNEVAPAALQGMDRLKARAHIVEMLGEALVKVEPVKHAVPYGDRSGSVVEPYLTEQWFMNMQPLAKAALQAVQADHTRFVPENWVKTYNQWLENIQPWCLSRQLWWGHRIPAWYDANGKYYVAKSVDEAAAQAGVPASELRQDEDVLDTWFSSGLWPLSTLNWLEEFESQRYPTSTLVTGFDIIFFWVARMLMQCIYLQAKRTDADLGQRILQEQLTAADGEKLAALVPFKDVYIHALVRDKNGQKMSKSKGNVIDPLEMVEQFGADALRFTLASQAGQGRDVRLSEDAVKGYRNFCTKIWNAARFGEMNGCFSVEIPSDWQPKNAVNQWICNQLQGSRRAMDMAIKEYGFNTYALEGYRFTWNLFCDWYIELVKPLLNADDLETKQTFNYVFGEILQLLHPVMPFVTAELQEKLGLKVQGTRHEGGSNDTIPKLIDLITAIRSARSELNVPAGATLQAYVVNPSEQFAAVLSSQTEALHRLARLTDVTTLDAKPTNKCLQVVTDFGTLLLDVDGIVDFAAEAARLQKELEKSQKDRKSIEGRLNNPGFVAKAPAEVVNENRQRVESLQQQEERLQASIKRVSGF